MQSKVPPRQTDQHSQGMRPTRGLGLWIRRGLAKSRPFSLPLFTRVRGRGVLRSPSTLIDEASRPNTLSFR